MKGNIFQKKKWLVDLDQKMLTDLEVFKELELCNQTDAEDAVRQFPYQETADSDSRIALCICVILRRLRKEFVAEYLPVLKTWVKDQLTQEKMSNEGDLMLIIEYISALESPDALVDGYIKFWQEILESGTAVKVSKETVEKLKRLTIVITMQQAKELRKVIATLNYAR